MGLTGCRQFRRRTPRPATCISTPKGVNPKAATNRAFGLQLRCLQEEGPSGNDCKPLTEKVRRFGRVLPMTADATPGGRPQCSLRSLATLRWRQPRNYSAPLSLTARLGDSFYFAISEIVESLLRRGAHPSGVLLASRLQPALSARWRKSIKQRELFGRFPTPAVARGSSHTDKQELRSGRAGPAYAAEARP